MSFIKPTKKELWKAIRDQCLECGGGVRSAVLHCGGRNCALYPYRFGRPLSPDDVGYYTIADLDD